MHDETLRAIRQLNTRLGYVVDDKVVEDAAHACHVLILPKKRTLFHMGDMPHQFYRVLKGCVQLHITPPDSEEKRIMALLREGDSICHEAALLGEAYPVSAESVCDTQVIACPREFVHGLIRSNPGVASNMLLNLSRQSLNTTRRMGDLMMKSGLARVACYLLEHAPRVHSNTFEVTLPASKQSVASHLHLSQEAFSRVLADLKKAGLLEVRGRVITVLDGVTLAQVKSGISLKELLPGVAATLGDCLIGSVPLASA